MESLRQRVDRPHTPTTELLLQVVLAARAAGLLSGSLQPGPSERDLQALQLLVILGPLRASDLASVLRISRAAATRLIDGLEHAGLASREPDPRDRRAVLVNATVAGRLLALSEVAPAAVLSRAIELLPEDDRQALTRGLESLLAQLGQQLPPTRHHALRTRRRERE
ncbi:MAG: MarR family transcriptional regulator [Thermomicrobium sp.]|nr:MarR family transcriptional regulator [Thermomicrobium sp.]MDW8058583.1 MarR family transcriptional regulator [Thermomicrobium sp.]